MLSYNTTTPRPRPPAKARRSTSNLKASGTPPPAYASSFPLPAERHNPDALLGSPMTATFQMVGWEASPMKEDMDWVNEKSRQELAELLVKADGLIKERENELGITSTVCKNLYESNVTLQTKHQALLARLPISPSQTASPEFSSSTLPRTPPRENATLDVSTPESVFGPYGSSRPSTPRHHTRKISMSSNDISLLADQNAELLHKLEKLESEAISADQVGRRELKRLEKEIIFLREELEKTQAKSEELEQKTKDSFGRGSEKAVEEAWRKKKSREAKFKKMRDPGRNFSSEGSHEIRNFAPEGSSFRGPSTDFSFFPTSNPDTYAQHENVTAEPLNSSLHPEHAIVSQLLGKIQELEAANTRIVDKQLETTNQLQAVQRETENMAKVYECLVDPSEVQLELEMDDMDGWKSVSSTNETIRFRSFRRKLDNRLTLATSTQKNIHKHDFGGSFRARRSVIGLFDEGNRERESSNQPNVTNPLDLPVPFPTEISSISWNGINHRASSSFGGHELNSPTLSTLGIFSPMFSPAGGRPPTLESELGDEFTESWGINAGNHHLRTTSLCDFSQFSALSSPSPLRSPRSETLGASSMVIEQGSLLTSVAPSSGPHLSVEPSTPDAQDSARGSAPKSPRAERMSQTIRSRTRRWTNGRFSDTLTGDATGPVEDGTSASLHGLIPDHLANAIDNMVENFTGATALDKPTEQPHIPSPTESPKNVKAVQLHNNSAPKSEKHGIGAVLLELWLWLQFAIIILVFLWAMAKRGPKSVLFDAEHRRAVARQS